MRPFSSHLEAPLVRTHWLDEALAQLYRIAKGII